jgi:hypothetical protein
VREEVSGYRLASLVCGSLLVAVAFS